jgi:hypothetical protein
MPVQVVKSEADEKRWTAAKAQAKEAGHENDWPYVMSIFNSMKGNSAKMASVKLAMMCGARQIYETKRMGRSS